MPDPVPPRQLLYRLRDASRSFTDLRSAHARGQRAERDELGTLWHKMDASGSNQGSATSEGHRSGTPESLASPRSPASPDDKRGKIPSPLSFRPRASSNASDGGRLSRAQKGKQVAEGVPAVPPLPPFIVPQMERVQWPCRQWLPRLGPSGSTALALPIEPWPPEALPTSFDRRSAEALRLLVHTQCNLSGIKQFVSQGPDFRLAMNTAARFVGLHCLEKREQLKREHARAERDLQSIVDWRQGYSAICSAWCTRAVTSQSLCAKSATTAYVFCLLVG